MEGKSDGGWVGVIFFWGARGWLWAKMQQCLVIWPTIPFNPRTLICPPLSTASFFSTSLFLSCKWLLSSPPWDDAKLHGNKAKFLPVVANYKATENKAFRNLLAFIVIGYSSNTKFCLTTVMQLSQDICLQVLANTLPIKHQHYYRHYILDVSKCILCSSL